MTKQLYQEKISATTVCYFTVLARKRQPEKERATEIGENGLFYEERKARCPFLFFADSAFPWLPGLNLTFWGKSILILR
ncbi:MAG: hypothetical protein HQK59_17700 [Deltaproteobacteria bacterium]|nr:hypothetical protein [Deltaproteobacteria bacterium]